MASNALDVKYKFVSEPEDDLVCLICLEVAEDPYQHVDCGRLLCKQCLDKLGKDKPCPSCRKEKPQYFPDNRSKRNIRNLLVKCANVDKMCEWVGTISTLKQHVASCKFTPLPCPNGCKDDSNKVNYIMRKDLDAHLERDCPNREYECEYCGEKGTHLYITGFHDIILCPMKILPCPQNGCTEIMERQKIKTHVSNECEHTKIACKYETIGCETRLKRKDMVAHEENDKLHLRMAIDTTVNLKRQMAKLKEEKPTIFTFKLTGYQNKKENDILIDSPSFYTSPAGYHMYISVYANGSDEGKGTHISVFACLEEGDNDDELKWPFVGDVTVTLLNQLEDDNHLSEIITSVTEHNFISHVGKGRNLFCPHSKLDYDQDKNTQYLKDDTLYFRVSVEVADHKPWLECTD